MLFLCIRGYAKERGGKTGGLRSRQGRCTEGEGKKRQAKVCCRCMREVEYDLEIGTASP